MDVCERQCLEGMKPSTNMMKVNTRHESDNAPGQIQSQNMSVSDAMRMLGQELKCAVWYEN